MFTDVRFRLRALFRRNVVERELDEELRGHFVHQVDKLIASGLTQEEAIRRTKLEFGGLDQVKEECRDTRGINWLEDMGQDLIYGLRMMRREPGFTIAALLVIALGIGVSTAIFSADHAVLFRVLPYRNPGQLVEVFQKYLPRPSINRMPVSPANYFDWHGDREAFQSFAAWQVTNFNVNGSDNPERIRAAQVSANLFDMLGVEPMLGRVFESGEESLGRDSVVILSYGLWQRRFAGNQAVLGKTIVANDRKYTVIGVMPRVFRFPIGWMTDDVEIWKPLALDDSQRFSRKEIMLDVVARLRPDTSVSQAQASLDPIARRLAQTYPETNKDWGVNVMPLADRGVSDFRGLFVLLSIAVSLVLLIACANVANLLLARGTERQNELNIRSALGAQKNRLVRQLITEGVLLSFCGGWLGIGIGYLGIRALTFLAPMELPDLKQAALNGPVVMVSVSVSVLSGFLFSVLPALALSRRSLHGNLQEAGRSSTGTIRAARMKAALVIGEVALTLALLLCAGDVLNSFFSYMRIDPGFDPTNVLTMRLSLSKQKYGGPQQWTTFFNRAVEEIGVIPGVAVAAVGTNAPMGGGGAVLRFHIAGSMAAASISEHSIAEYFRTTSDYFRAAGIRLRRGRTLLPSDKDGRTAVAVVNETFARQQFGEGDPIGQRVLLDGDVNASAAAKTAGPPLEIVGVVRDTKDYGLFQTVPQMIYVPLAQDPEPAMSLLVKTIADPDSVIAEVRSRLARLDPDQPVYRIRSLKQIVSEEHAFFRFNTLLLAAFAGLALVLSLIGIYGVVAYAVSQRSKEFGIRLALGSPRHKILTLVLCQGAWLSIAGIGLGLALAWPATRLLARTLKESMLLTLVQTGPELFPALCAGIALTMMLACIFPARRATKADPMQALRCE
jgi:putative ABC transport system permease protein